MRYEEDLVLFDFEVSHIEKCYRHQDDDESGVHCEVV